MKLTKNQARKKILSAVIMYTGMLTIVVLTLLMLIDQCCK